MNRKTVGNILAQTAYIRTAGSPKERQCAEFFRDFCKKQNLQAQLQPFALKMYEVTEESLQIDGRQIPCTGYRGAANGTVTGKLFYLTSLDPVALRKCKDKIVLSDKRLDRNLYDLLADYGAKGVITYSGNAMFADRDIEIRELRFLTGEDKPLPAVNIHVCDAIELVKSRGKTATITLSQIPYTGHSNNVVLDLPGQSRETVVVSAHYDSTDYSNGAYDNMSSCITLLYLAEYFASVPHKRSIRLLWCGAEERGLLGSLAYCCQQDLKETVLNINLDMLGSAMGEFTAFSCADEPMQTELKRFLAKHRYEASVRYGIRSSDSNSFVYYGIPAVSFARYAPGTTAAIHTRYDSLDVVDAGTLLRDSKLIAAFTQKIADAPQLHISISQKIKEEVDAYMERSGQTK